MVEVEAQINILERRVAIALVVAKDRVVGLILIRRQSHFINGLIAQFQELYRLVRNNPVNKLLDAGTPLEVIRVRVQQDILIGLPLLKTIRTRPDGGTVSRMRIKIPFFVNMFR